MSALTCIGICHLLYMSFCSFAFAFTFGDEHGSIDKGHSQYLHDHDNEGRPQGSPLRGNNGIICFGSGMFYYGIIFHEALITKPRKEIE